MKKPLESIWTRPMRTYLDDAEVLADCPTGGRSTQWLAGVVLASVPVLYGLVCLKRGYATLIGRHADLRLTGNAGFWLAVAYLAAGAFLHFHYFWGLSPRLSRFSQLGKILSLLVFLPSFVYAIYRIFV